MADPIDEAVERAIRSWPSVSRVAFAAWLRDRDGDARLDDLALCCACASGDRAALEAFESRCFPQVERALARMGLGHAVVDDVKQGLLSRWFTGDAGIRSYSGRGALEGWVRVAATRDAIRARKASAGAIPLEDRLLDVLPALAPKGADLGQFRETFREEFRVAFEGALTSLPARERSLLRMRFLDGLTGEQIATVFRITRATVTRRIATARQSVLDRTRAALASRLGLGQEECDSLLRLVQSDLDVSISRYLE